MDQDTLVRYSLGRPTGSGLATATERASSLIASELRSRRLWEQGGLERKYNRSHYGGWMPLSGLVGPITVAIVIIVSADVSRTRLELQLISS